MNILAIETSTSVCGLAVFSDSHLLAMKEEEIPKQHTLKLPSFYDDVMKDAQLSLNEIDALAISIGPGSFTGLRIGTSFAKGLAFAHNIPMIPVPTLLSLAEQTKINVTEIRVILHSHREMVFVQDFHRSDTTISETSTVKFMNWKDATVTCDNFCVVHYGCDKLFREKDREQSWQKTAPSSRYIGEIALRDYTKRKVDDFFKVEPEYGSEILLPYVPKS